MKGRVVISFVGIFLAVWGGGGVFAADYPTRPITIMVPWPLNPPFFKGGDYSSLYQREAGRDFWDGQTILVFYNFLYNEKS